MAFILAFVVAGLILIIGYAGDYFFKRKRIPDILILIIIGLLLGPVFRVVKPGVLDPVSDIFAALALVIILFDGGLNLSLYRVLKESPRAIALAGLGVTVSAVLTMIFMFYTYHWSLIDGLLLGTIIGGTSSSVVIPLISREKMSTKTKTLLSLESAFTDALVVVLAIVILQIVTTGVGSSISEVSGAILAEFSIGAVIGAIAGIAWLRFLGSVKKQIYNDILTLSIVILFYSLVEAVGGSGAIFALTFGLVLGNGKDVCRMLRMKETLQVTRMMKTFMAEMSFFMKTFFFVYIGLIFTFTNYTTVLYGILLSFILLGGRYLSAWVVSMKSAVLRENINLVSIMLPRGLAAAVFVEILKSFNVPYLDTYANIIITVIMTTVIIGSVGSSIIRRKQNI